MTKSRRFGASRTAFASGAAFFRYAHVMYAELDVPEALRSSVAAIWTYTGTGSPHRVLPDGCLDFIFNLSRGSASVVGPMSRGIVVPAARGVTSFGVRFRPGHAARFIDAHASELLDRQAGVRELTRVAAVGERILNARDHRERTRLIAGALLDASTRVRPLDARVDRAVRRIYDARGQVSIPELALSVGLGERQLERRFREHVGLGPKRLARVVRFERALALARREIGAQAELAARAGYSDEPHLLRDFRALSGLTPAALVRELGRKLEHETDVGIVQVDAHAAG